MRYGTVLSRNRLTLDHLEHVEHHDTEQLNACPARKEQLRAQPAVNLGQPIPVILVYKLKLGLAVLRSVLVYLAIKVGVTGQPVQLKHGLAVPTPSVKQFRWLA